MQDFYTVEQVAKILQLEEVTIRRHINAGKLEAVKIGKVWRISEEALQKLIDGQAIKK